jgi:hypothetical protein
MKVTSEYVDRLVNNWRQHGKIIIGVDFDDTIAPYMFNEQSTCNEVINLVREAIKTGAYIVIHTACNPDRHREILEYCSSVGIIVSSINKNPISLPYGEKGKPLCNIYLDDRAGLNEACNILQQAIYVIRGERESSKLTNQNTEF